MAPYTLVTRIVEKLRIAVMGGKFLHVMDSLENIVKFMDANLHPKVLQNYILVSIRVMVHF